MPPASAARMVLFVFGASLLGSGVHAKAQQVIASDDQACDRVMAVLAANKTYHAEQMASCDGGKDDNNPGYYVLRVNAHCRDPQGCGSVLLGWYVVEAVTGAVHDWDVGDWQIGQRIDREK